MDRVDRLLLAGLLTLPGGCGILQPGAPYSTAPCVSTATILASGLANAVDFEVAADGRFFILDRLGTLLVYNPKDNALVTAAELPVFYGNEDGLLGVALDPGFSENHFIYLYYSPKDKWVNRLSRFTLSGDRVDLGSEQVLLEVPTQRQRCCHSAGNLDFDAEGNLYLATGDNTQPGAYAALHEEDSRLSAEKSASNTMDLRGKILRITPRPDGGYEIPPGNLFPHGKGGRAEIYVMGARNPYKIFVDRATGWLIWGDLGPDARAPSVYGPPGKDEINLTRAAGNFGWPYFVGHNIAYRKAADNSPWKAESPVNDSVWNTGMRQLPPAQPAWLQLARAAHISGPLYRFDANVSNPRKLPRAFHNSVFFWDFLSSRIWHVTLSDVGALAKVERFAPDLELGPGLIDMEIGPDHNLYALAFGEACCDTRSRKGVLSRIDVACPADPRQPKHAVPAAWRARMLDENLPWRAVFVDVADMDGDGKQDIVTGAWWYRNPGSADGQWQRRDIGEKFDNMVHVQDFDRDGDPDVLGTTGRYTGVAMLWAQNDGEGGFTVHHNVPAGTSTHAEPFVAGVAGGPFTTSDEYQLALSWNGGETGSSAVQMLSVPREDPVHIPWRLQPIHPFSEGEALSAGDIDGDGDRDLFQGSKWLRNEGNGSWTQYEAQRFLHTVDRNRLTDIDGDGDLDAVVGFFERGAPLLWLEKTEEQFWAHHVIASRVGGGLSFDVADMDADGDSDVVLGELYHAKRLLWFENLGLGLAWQQHVIHPGTQDADHHDGSLVVDIDNDGDLDVVSIGWLYPKLRLFLNEGPQ